MTVHIIIRKVSFMTQNIHTYLYFKFYFLHSNNHISDTNSTQKLQKQINCSPCLKLSPLDFENFLKVIKRGKPFLKRK